MVAELEICFVNYNGFRVDDVAEVAGPVWDFPDFQGTGTLVP